MKIAIKKEDFGGIFEGEEYVIDMYRKFDGYEAGDLICDVSPWGASGCPIRLELAIRRNGDIAFRGWSWSNDTNYYLQTHELNEEDAAKSWAYKAFIPTDEQVDTVNSLFSGRIKWEGLKLSPGGTLQKICPIDTAREESLTGKKIYLA